mmetsp:Transcript_21559/g.42835  ORF Transcript_21559/g.42835 Transcript_21559/m.42835 type:complete len:416 (+) Transcript_21559:149-1396(+)
MVVNESPSASSNNGGGADGVTNGCASTLGLLSVALGAFFSSCMVLCIKLASDAFSVSEIVLVRGGTQAVFCLITFFSRKALFQGNYGAPSTALWGDRKSVPWLFFRGAFSGVSILVMAFCLTQLDVGDVSSLMQTAPVFTAIIGRFWLKESGHWVMWPAGVGALVGVFLIIRPPFIFGDDEDNKEKNDSLLLPREASVALCVGAALGQAMVNLSTRKLVHVAFETNVLPGTVVAILIAGIALAVLQRPTEDMVDRAQRLPFETSLMGLVFVGVAGFGALSLQAIGMQLEKAGPASFMMSLEVVVSFLFQVTLLKSALSVTSLLGAVLVVLSTLSIVSVKICRNRNRGQSVRSRAVDGSIDDSPQSSASANEEREAAEETGKGGESVGRAKTSVPDTALSPTGPCGANFESEVSEA